MHLAKIFAVSVGAVAASATLITPTTLDYNTLTKNQAGPPFVVEVVANGVPRNGRAYQLTVDQKKAGQAIGLDLGSALLWHTAI